MWRHFCVTFAIIHISAQQSCEFYCLSDDNCVQNNEITANATIDKTKGIVDLQFDFECSIDTYKIIIFYNKNVCGDFEHHSTYWFTKIRYSNYTNIHIDRCSITGVVPLQNIQTGCYLINILDQERNIIYKNVSFWETLYIKQELDLLKTNITQNSRNNGTELILIIENPILNSIPEFSLQFECEKCPKYRKQQHPYHMVRDKANSYKLILNPEDDKTPLNISCHLEKNKNNDIFASCYIFPVTVGHYNIVITFVGDPYKCAFNKPEAFKLRMKNIHVKADKLLQQPPSYNKTITGAVLGIICILLLFSVFSLIIKLGKINIRHFNKINVEEHKDISLSETNFDLLLLYSRNSEDIMTTLTSFRNIFKHQGIQVYDVYDPKRLSEINENNFNWILNLTSRQNIKIIIFLTPSARNLSNLPQIQNSIDYIYPFAMKHLLNQISNDKEFHKKIFVAHFSNDVYNYSDYNLFCPHLRFRVPDDFIALLRSVFNTRHISMNNKSNNEFNKLKENYEKHEFAQENILYRM